MTITQMRAVMKRLKACQAILDRMIYNLGLQLWDAEVKAVKPNQMCRRRWRSDCYCALRKGHEGICQGMAPGVAA